MSFASTRSLVALAVATLGLSALAAHADTVYSTLPPATLGNESSVGFAATQTSQIGDEVTLAGTARNLSSVTVAFSDWSTKSTYFNTDGSPKAGTTVTTDAGNTGYYVPVTVNVYSVDHTDPTTPATGSVLATVTDSTFIPWRPENDPSSPDGVAYKAADGNYYHGSLSTGSFDFSSLGVTLPDDVIVGVAYNTSGGGPVSALNVALNPTSPGPSVGADPDATTIFIDSPYENPGETGFIASYYDWSGTGTPAFAIAATPEPASLGLLGVGAVPLLAKRRRRSA